MQYTATLTQKGQVTIPKEIREKLGVKPRGKIMFVQDSQGYYQIKPVATIDELAGSLKVPDHLKGMTDRDWDKAIEKAKVSEYEEKLEHS
jgi:AbrB family looped-hinge helix DNA binding protein